MRKIIFATMAALMLLSMLSGCVSQSPIEVIYKDAEQSEQDEGTDETANTAMLRNVEYPKSIAFDDYEAQKSVVEENQVDESIIEAINEFAAESSSAILADVQGNSCYSPASLYMALALLATGTGTETRQELTMLLGEEDTNNLSEQMGKLFRQLYKDNDVSKLYMTNSLWINKDHEIKQGFIDNAAENFYAAVNNLDFADPEAGKTISKWISDNTGGLLEPEIETDILDLMFIINTVYLKDEWKNNFDEAATGQAEFTLADGSKTDTDFMHGVFECEAVQAEDYTSVSLPLKSTGSMMFVLLGEGVDINSFLSSAESLAKIMDTGDAEQANVTISLPKFSFDNKYDLINNLKTMGAGSMFGFDTADLTGITDEEARVSKVDQGTNITVNENGLEAAAYTMIEIELRGALVENELEINFDRPFLFIVRSDAGVPLFIGTVQNPAE